ncbi:hypothetical protein [Psychrobacillus phage Perkons]|nr:hypothetical protein [Psychrobacillus phage Perkons]
MKETVKLSRIRPTEYSVNYNNGLTNIPFRWAGAKDSNVMSLDVPMEVFNYLNLQTKAIRTGALVISKDEVKFEEVKGMISDVEEYENNSLSRDEIITLLKGNINKMKSELNKVNARSAKLFIKQIKDELEQSEGMNSKKSEFVDEWFVSKDEDSE